MNSVQNLKAAISKECDTVPLLQVTSMCKAKTNKRRRLGPKPVVQLAHGVEGTLLNEAPGNVIIANPHDAAAVYMSGCYGKGSMSKGAPTGLLDQSEHLILSPCEAMYLVEVGALILIQPELKQVCRSDLYKLWMNHDAGFCEKFIIYKHFRDKKYTVRSGIKYGGDFMLYTGDPNTSHAAYVVKVMTTAQEPLWTDVNALRRVNESVAKESVLSYVSFSHANDRNNPDCVDSAIVSHVLLKRWIPERDREIASQKLEKIKE